MLIVACRIDKHSSSRIDFGFFFGVQRQNPTLGYILENPPMQHETQEPILYDFLW